MVLLAVFPNAYNLSVIAVTSHPSFRVGELEFSHLEPNTEAI